MNAEEFERAVLAQRPVDPGRYDAGYFGGTWRGDDNRYDLETRRRIEDRHPQLIKDAFAPHAVLDVGCGPGFLMQLLYELGVEADGIDASSASITLAPPAVRDRIRLGDITEPHVARGSYDLVICREVLEHLTVVQVHAAITQLCRASSRFVYVTTRFHPDPEALLDLTDEPAVDPTHITLLPKDLVRVLLVLQGFRTRHDIEDRLDWAGKGRVIVVERVAPLGA